MSYPLSSGPSCVSTPTSTQVSTPTSTLERVAVRGMDNNNNNNNRQSKYVFPTSDVIFTQASILKQDEEHHLILMYARKLNEQSVNERNMAWKELGKANGNRVSKDENLEDEGNLLSSRESKNKTTLHEEGKILTSLESSNKSLHEGHIVTSLESKNKNLEREIKQLKLEHEFDMCGLTTGGNVEQLAPDEGPNLLLELHSLRQRKDELETRMSTLQETRRDLMVQLEVLMKMLKTTSKSSNGSNTQHLVSQEII